MVLIPKSDGGKRPLGIPTVADRIAQTAATLILEPLVDVCFDKDSYGYRPNKSAHQAIDQARQRYWKYARVIDLDIKEFFDNLGHQLVLKAVEKHTSSRWLRFYVERWLTACVQHPDGTLSERAKRYAAWIISLVLANLLLHYAFDH